MKRSKPELEFVLRQVQTLLAMLHLLQFDIQPLGMERPAIVAMWLVSGDQNLIGCDAYALDNCEREAVQFEC